MTQVVTESIIEYEARKDYQQLVADGYRGDFTLEGLRAEVVERAAVVDDFYGWWDELIRDLAQGVGKAKDAHEPKEKIEVDTWVVANCLAVLDRLADYEIPERMLHELLFALRTSAAAELGMAEMGRHYEEMKAKRTRRDSVTPSA